MKPQVTVHFKEGDTFSCSSSIVCEEYYGYSVKHCLPKSDNGKQFTKLDHDLNVISGRQKGVVTKWA